MKKVLLCVFIAAMVFAFAGMASAAPTVNSNYPGFTWGEADLTSATLNGTQVVPSYSWLWHTSSDVSTILVGEYANPNLVTALENDDVYA